MKKLIFVLFLFLVSCSINSVQLKKGERFKVNDLLVVRFASTFQQSMYYIDYPYSDEDAKEILVQMWDNTDVCLVIAKDSLAGGSLEAVGKIKCFSYKDIMGGK